jgi:hypothetical protein
MKAHDDPVDAVIVAYLDHLEGAAPRPTLDHLGADDRRRAQAILDGLTTARTIDPHASRPTIEALLADTPLARLLPAPEAVRGADFATVVRALAGVDRRARVQVDEQTSTVVYSYLDLRARFLLVPAGTPAVTDAVRARVGALFDRDADTSRIGIVAAGSEELTTQVLAADDLADTITTPRGEPHLRWEPALPLRLAAQRMLEQSSPEWPAFDFDQAYSEPFDLPAVAAEIARLVIEREAARSYRGEKRRAYRALVGQERIFADLVAKVSAHGPAVDLAAETTRIWRAAA